MNRFFQALIGTFLTEHLPEHTVASEHPLRGMISYVPGWNPRRQQAAIPRPDFVISHGQRILAILDAKYRDLWEHSLTREMLYQLAIYALIGELGTATILYPTIHGQATEARIALRDPHNGGHRAIIALRPVPLERLDDLISARPTAALQRQRQAFARELAFGTGESRQGG